MYADRCDYSFIIKVCRLSDLLMLFCWLAKLLLVVHSFVFRMLNLYVMTDVRYWYFGLRIKITQVSIVDNLLYNTIIRKPNSILKVRTTIMGKVWIIGLYTHNTTDSQVSTDFTGHKNCLDANST